MTRRFINQLGEHESVDEVFLVAEKQLRANRNGNLYLQLRLTDKTGSLTAMLWNANDQVYGSFENGDYLRVQGTSQFYNGALQMILNRIERVNASSVDPSQFVTVSSAEIDALAKRLGELLRGMNNDHLRNLAECFLVNDEFMQRFTSAPAGIKLHHAYRGGLLQHVVSLMEVVVAVAPLYPRLDGDLLLMGAFLHDIGKIDELSYERELTYSDEGQLIGHLVIGVRLLEQAAADALRLAGEAIPDELLLRLKHMIVSHHGQLEFGSPKLPMTPEAIALHHLDNLDAKLHSVLQLLDSDATADSRWTTFEPALGRKLFKGATDQRGSSTSASDGNP